MSDISAAGFRFGLAVVIATKNRSEELANRSVPSVVAQTLRPDYVVVVDDSDRKHRPANRVIVANADLPNVRVAYLKNDRTPGASGAWNVGLDFLHRSVAEPANLFVAILDDDDRWASDHLRGCAQLASDRDLDMVAADILRIEQMDALPLLISAPDSLRAADFLVGNPGIQGSSLFIRLSVLLAAGLFDEGLQSTTDRDLCIRIADLGGVRYGRRPHGSVEHYAEEGRERLSTRGSEPKLQGLTKFWLKYSGRMTDTQQREYQERAQRLFGWHAGPVPPPAGSRPPLGDRPSSDESVALIIGIIADTSRSGPLRDLLQDLLRLQDDARLSGLDILLLENGEPSTGAGHLDQAVQMICTAGAGCYVVPIERQVADAGAGLFGQPFERRQIRATIAVARTMLQTYAYVLAKARPGAVVWILDEDCRLDNLFWDGARVVERPSDIVDALVRLRAAKVDIAIGTVTDAPPVPFASCVRTQLVDAYHNLALMAAQNPDAPWPDRQAENMDLRVRCKDYYYDLSRRDTDHLETPFWYVPQAPGSTVREAFRELVGRLPRILAGEQVFRPLILDDRDPLSLRRPSVHRGANTFVLDIEALRDFPNASPRIDGSETRRSDMVWSLLNLYVAGRKVEQLPIAVRQDRRDQPVDGLDLKKLARDIQGYALYSALADALLEQLEKARSQAADAPLLLERIDAAHLDQRMHKYLRERLAAFSLSFHRAEGLSRLLGRCLDEPIVDAPWWLSDVTCAEAVASLRRFINELRREYDLSRLRDFKREALAVGTNVGRRFLDQLQTDIAARGRSGDAVHDVERWMQHERVAIAEHWVRREFGLEHLRLLGCGSEAVVLTDDLTVYKCFDHLPRSRMDFLRAQIGRWEDVPGLYPLREVRASRSRTVLTYDYEPSTPYRGGHGEGLIRLLQSCRQVGIVCNNVHPNNLVVTATGVKLVDYGSDIRPFSVEEFEHMVRRAFLSWKHPDRADLKEIMRRALDDHDLPELAGFHRFREALEPISKERLLDLRVAAELGVGDGRAVLDYGCGKGKLAEMLATAGWTVTAYDPDPTLPLKWRRMNGGVRFGGPALLEELLRSRARFHTVICCLVFCQLDDANLVEVTRNLVHLTQAGGRLVVGVCNPRFVRGTTQLQRRMTPVGVSANDVFQLEKHVFSTGARIVDVHRPAQHYLDLFEQHGLAVEAVAETPAVDLATFDHSSDFMIFQLRRIAVQVEVVRHASP